MMFKEDTSHQSVLASLEKSEKYRSKYRNPGELGTTLMVPWVTGSDLSVQEHLRKTGQLT